MTGIGKQRRKVFKALLTGTEYGKDLYNPALKEAKKSGLSNKEAMQKAIQKTFLEAVKASNEAVRECNEGM